MDRNYHDVLVFACPRCQHLYSDTVECLQHNQPHEFTCESCAKPFILFLAECNACGEESAFSWLDKKATPANSELVCAHCAQPLLGNEEDHNHDGADS